MTALAAFLLFSHVFAGQSQSGRARVGDPIPPLRGTVYADYDSLERPQSLTQLIKAADLIVEGTVESVLPGRLRDINQPRSVETDSIFVVNRVLKGALTSLRRIVITQPGGKYGELEVLVYNEAPLRVGERHILFLHYDRRGIAPVVARTEANFTIVGQWVGNFQIQDNTVKWLGPSDAQTFRKFESGTAEDFIAQIVAEVSAPQ